MKNDERVIRIYPQEGWFMTDVKGNASVNRHIGKRSRKRPGGRWPVVWIGLLGALCLGANAGTACADTGTEAVTGADGFLHITRMVGPEQAGEPVRPEETCWDSKGNRYELERYEVKEVPGQRVDRSMEKQMVYRDVEGAEEIPQSIEVCEELSEDPAQGRLYLRDSRIVREGWQDGFQAPVLFHSYGAEEYAAGSGVIDGRDVLSSSLEAQEEILGLMGLKPGEYRILSMEWAGEPFEDEEGQVCRQAMASGQKLVRDYEAAYEGTISYMEPPSYELELFYRLAPSSPAGVDQGREEGMDAREAAAPVPGAKPCWYWVRKGVVVTLGAGLIGLGVGVMILVSAWLRKRRRQRQERYLPELRG